MLSIGKTPTFVHRQGHQYAKLTVPVQDDRKWRKRGPLEGSATKPGQDDSSGKAVVTVNGRPVCESIALLTMEPPELADSGTDHSTENPEEDPFVPTLEVMATLQVNGCC